jgi:hypothetical protein
MARMKLIKSVVQVGGNTAQKCPECGEPLKKDRVADAVNHLLAHDYTVEHIGQETSPGAGGPWHHTVAVLAKRE